MKTEPRKSEPTASQATESKAQQAGGLEMGEWLPLEDSLPLVDAKVLSKYNIVFNHNQEIEFDLGLETYAFSFSAHEPLFLFDMCMDIHINKWKMKVSFDKLFFIDLLDGVHTMHLPDEIKSAYVEVLFESALKRLEAFSHSRVSIGTIRFDAEPFPDYLDRIEALSQTHAPLSESDPKEPRQNQYGLYFNLVRRRDDLNVHGMMYVNDLGLAWLSDLYLRAPLPAPSIVDQLPVLIRFELGKTQLRSGDLKKLAHDDIVLLDESTLSQEEKLCAIRVANRCIGEAIIEKEKITVVKTMEATMPENKTKEMKEGAVNLDNIEIELTFDLGGQTISIGDFKAIQPGFTFDLQKGLDHPVTIRANGKVFGQGKLVRINDQLGVRFVETDL